MSDVRINTRSPYYINADRGEREPVTIPDPVENNTPPTVTLTASNENPYLGETVTLTATASDSDGTIVSYTWGGAATGSPAQAVVTVTKAANANPVTETYVVTVADDDGDTAVAYVQLNWQAPLPIGEIDDIDVTCGQTVNYSNLTGQQVFNLKPFDKIGNVEIEFLTPTDSNYDIPVKFDIEWNGNTATTGYIGSNSYDTELQNQGVASGDISTAATSNKKAGTSLIINKTAATPQEVTLTANSVLGNDTFKFTLNCPNVEPAETFFHTLTSTCSGGDTTFTYTDVNGDSQTIVVAEGATKVVSAQENTPVATTCTGTSVKGGQSFDLGRPEFEVNKGVEMNIWSMAEGFQHAPTTPLVESGIQLFSDHLLQYYGNDEGILNSKLRVEDSTFGRFFKWGATARRFSQTTTVLNVSILDSSLSSYHPIALSSMTASDAINNVRPRYASDLANLRSRYELFGYGGILNIVLCIEKYPDDEHLNHPFDRNATFTQFLDNLTEGKNGFTGTNGLSDRAEIIFRRNVLYNQEPEYYRDLIIEEMINFGFAIQTA